MKKINELKGLEDIRDFYFVTEDGRIISYGNYGSDVPGEAKELKQYEKTGGYLNVALMNSIGKTKYLRVHRLVALAFIPNPSEKTYVNHIDENRKNNHVNNLEWVTPKENNLHSLTKKVYVYNFEGDLVKTYNYTRECVVDGFNQGHVCSCARNEVKSHKNHIFSYNPLTKKDIVQRLSKPFYLNGDKRYK
ncbi:HNH endonuclease [Bacillus wiedmannii]|uniref:HNH endonuclease n=1 Tax=Bacillus wiedmannii TaxID=1890302 RepID=UPI003CECD373